MLSSAKFNYNELEITNLSNASYEVQFIYDQSIDTYDLTVDSVKYEMSPQSGSYTYFDSTDDMVLYK